MYFMIIILTIITVWVIYLTISTEYYKRLEAKQVPRNANICNCYEYLGMCCDKCCKHKPWMFTQDLPEGHICKDCHKAAKREPVVL